MTNQEYFDQQRFRFSCENLNPGLNNTQDCVIRAIMRATGQVTSDDWKRIYTELFTRGIDNYQMHHSPKVYLSYMEELGFEVHTIERYYDDQSVSLEQFLNQNTRGIYIIGVEGHAAAYINGMFYDNNPRLIDTRYFKGDKCPAKRYFSKAKHVLWYGVKEK